MSSAHLAVTGSRLGLSAVSVALGFAFWLLAVATAPVWLAAADLVALLVMYLLFAGILSALAAAAAASGWIGALLGALPLAAAIVWHVREQTTYPAARSIFLAAVLSSAVVVCVAARRLTGRGWASIWRHAAVAAALGAVLAVYVVVLYSASNTFRWHLLRHNKIIGTPAFFALSQPVDAVEAAIWQERVAPRALAASPVPAEPSAPATAHPDAPNIVFVLLDTLRADALAPYGGIPELMPNLNRLAERSYVFSDVLANSTWTRSSMASMFTGLPQELHGAVDRADRLPDERLTLSEALRDAGFETVAFVANFGAVGRDAGFAQGFQSFFEVADPQAPYARAQVLNQSLASWLAGRESPADVPLFLYLHYLDPHSPYLSGCDGQCPRAHPGEALRSYRKQLSYLDGQLQWVIEGLPAALGSRPTVLLVTSDHGNEFGDHGERGHGHSLYREVLHLPAILYVPARDPGAAAAGHRIDVKLEARDYFDLVRKLATDPAFDADAWAGGLARRIRYASVDITTPESAVQRPYLARVFMRGIERDGLFSIWSAYGNTQELYDAEADPEQRVNLARQRPEDLASLEAEMDRLYPHWVERQRLEATGGTIDLLRALGYVD